MTYQLSFALALGSANAGKTLVAKLFDEAGVQVGEDITAGFVEYGGGYYTWCGDIPEEHRGALLFYTRDSQAYGPILLDGEGYAILLDDLTVTNRFAAGITSRGACMLSEGRYVVIETNNEYLYFYDASRSVTSIIGGIGNHDGYLSAQARDIAVSASGARYVGDSQVTLRFDAEGNALPSFSGVTNNTNLHLALRDDASSLFVQDSVNSRILQLDASTGVTIKTYGSYGTTNGKFAALSCVASQGSVVYGGDTNRLRITKFTIGGTGYLGVHSTAAAPLGLAVEPVTLTEYVLTATNVLVYDSAGVLQSTIALPVGASASCMYIALCTGGFAIADTAGNAVWFYNIANASWWSITEDYSGETIVPRGVAFVGSEMHVVLSNRKKVGVFTVDFDLHTATLDSTYGAPYHYNFEKLVAVSSDHSSDEFYLLDAFDSGGARVIRINEIGQVLALVQSEASEEEFGFYNAANGFLAVSRGETPYVFVADQRSDESWRIQSFTSDCEPVASWNPWEATVYALAAGPDDAVYVVTEVGVLVYDVYGTLQSAEYPASLFRSVVIADNRAIYGIYDDGVGGLLFSALNADFSVRTDVEYTGEGVLLIAPCSLSDLLTDTLTGICAINPEEGELVANAASGIVALDSLVAGMAGDVGNLVTAVEAVPSAVWNALTSGLTTLGSIGKRLVDLITGTANTDSLEAIRDKLDTLPVTASQLAEVGNAGVFIATAYTRWTQSIALDRALTATWAKCYVSIKVSDGDTDEHAILRLQVTNPGDAAQDGIVRLNKTAGGDNRTKGTLTVAGDRATVTVELDDEIMAVLSEGTYTLDVKEIGAGSGESYRCAFGTVEIGLTTTRATA